MGVLRLPIFIYVCIKAGLSRLKMTKDQPDLIILLSAIFTVVTLPVTLAIYLLLSTVKTIINLHLQQKHQENYRGLMEGIDTLCCSQENCVPNGLTLVDFKGTLEDLKECVVKQVERTMATKHEKLFYSRSSFLGYHYYYKKYLPPSSYVEIMEVAGKEKRLTKQELSLQLIPYDKAPLPENDSTLYQVVICPVPVVFDVEPENENIYALLYRFHHCVGDGRSILHLFKGVLADAEKFCRKSPEINGKMKSGHRISTEKVRKFFTDVNIKDFPMSVSDRNILRGTNLTEEKYLAWFSDTGTECIDKIRKLRKSVSGLTFLDVINTCLACSLHDVYKKRGGPIPKSIIGGVVLSSETVSYTSYGSQDFRLTNRFSAASFRLPIDVGTESSGKLTTRLRMLKREYDSVKSSFDVQFNYWCTQNLMSKVPSQLIRWMATFLEITIGISSLPGCDQFTFFGGCVVKEFLLMPPNSPGTGLHVVIYTYKGHLRICLTADKSVIETYEEAQDIVDKTVSYLHELSSEDLKS